MLYAADFRARARQALNGNWVPAVVAGLIISLLNADGPAGPEFTIHFEGNKLGGSIEMFGQTILSTFENRPGLVAMLAGSVLLTVLAVITSAIVFGVIGSTVSVGYARFNLAMVDGFPADLGHLVGYFPHWKTAFCAHFLRGLYTLLWTLLFIVPGILANYNYAAVDYILATYPELTASEALERSKAIMYGNRWRLFCLRWSFFGWNILAALTMGIGNLWLIPYKQSAYAAFYRSLR